MGGREEGRRSSEDEQEQDKASQQLALSGSSGCNEGTPASSLDFDLPRIRVAFGEGGGAGKSDKAKDVRKKTLISNSPSRRPIDEEEDVAQGDGPSVQKKKKRETARLRTQGHLKTAQVGTSVPQM